jgi:hypothetical protein
MLLESDGGMPGLPGSSSFVDVEDLAEIFVKAIDLGPGNGEGNKLFSALSLIRTRKKID